MTSQRTNPTGKTDYAPPPIDGDFYRIAAVLNDSERALLKRVREFTEGVIAPVIEDYWSRDAFPFEIIPKMAEVGIGGVGYQGYGAAGGNWLLNGLVSMELARVDASVATFWGVHTGLSAGSIYLCGDEQQKQRWLPPMMRFDQIGSFGLTEPLVGSATSGGMTTTCRREGDVWILNGQKKWIGNATFADINVIWAREEGSNQCQGLCRGKGQSRLLGREDQDQDGLAGGAERADHAERLPRSRGRPPAERQLVQGHRQGSQDDAHRRGVVRRRLPDGSLRACAPLCDGADAIRQAYRWLPAGPGSAGAHARQRHPRPRR